MAAALSAPIAVALLGRRDLFPMLLLFALLILWRHHANIARLVAGKEPKIGERKA
jgi:glycerol-3-phosphate acyltransferase PlsY